MPFTNWRRAAARTIRHLRDARAWRTPVVFLDQRWPYHGAHSGYLIRSENAPALPRGDRVLPYPISQMLAGALGDDAWETRLVAHLILRAGGCRVLHLVDGDWDAWAYGRRPRWLGTRVTATFHQPPDRLGDFIRRLRPGMLDGIVCVSRVQIPLLQHLVPNHRCVFIPHGVDTEFFTETPTPTSVPRPIILAVGAHRRDYPTLLAAARIIKSHRPDARVRLIASREAVTRVSGEGLLDTASDLSDVDLRNAYREATLLLLPLEAATANNALLESMASGRAAVITDLPAIREYADPETAVFCPAGDAMAHAQATLDLLAAPSLCARMGRAARRRAAELAWPRVRRALNDFLQTVAGRNLQALQTGARPVDFQ